MELPEMLTQGQVAEWLKTSPASVSRMVKAGKIPHVVLVVGKTKKTVRFVKSDMVAWLGRRTRGAGGQVRGMLNATPVVTGNNREPQVIELKGDIPVQQTGCPFNTSKRERA